MHNVIIKFNKSCIYPFPFISIDTSGLEIQRIVGVYIYIYVISYELSLCVALELFLFNVIWRVNSADEEYFSVMGYAVMLHGE